MGGRRPWSDGDATVVTMCRQYALDLGWDDVAARYGVTGDGMVDDDLPPVPCRRFEPRHPIGIVARGRDGRNRLAAAHWSLVPRWSRDFDLPYPTYNARSESAASKPTFADSVRSMRAVVPATGYFEFKGDRPFYFHAPDGSPLAMAGLYSWWRDPSATTSTAPSSPWRLTATILTCPALDAFAKVHDRMPLLVPPDMVAAWLDHAQDGRSLLRGLRTAGPELSRSLAFHEVTPAVPEVGGADLIAPLARADHRPEAEQPALF